MDLIGRHAERQALEYCEKTDKSELVCVYGRRRVGKTYLVEQTLGPYFAFHVVGSKNATLRAQLREFGLELTDCGDPNPNPPANWREAFNRLYKVIWLFCILGRCLRGVRTGRAPLSGEVQPRACQSRGL